MAVLGWRSLASTALVNGERLAALRMVLREARDFGAGAHVVESTATAARDDTHPFAAPFATIDATSRGSRQ